MQFECKTKGTCSQRIYFRIEDGKVYDVEFLGGCNGNLQGIGKLVEGMEATKVIEILRGNDCRGRGTSCADQLAQGIELALQEQNEG